MNARMLILCLTPALASGCTTETQTRRPNYVVSLNVSLESQIDPANKAKVVIEIKPR